MAVLGSLKVLLFGDSTQLEKTLKSTRKGVDTFKNYAVQAAGAIGVAFSFTAAIQGLSKFYNKLDEIGKRSSALGVTAEYYQKMQYAAERTGSSLDQVYASMNRLVKFAGDAKIGNAEAQKTFEALGISMSEVNGLRTDELFDLVNRRLAEMPDNLARNAYGAKLMGEEYGRMSNYLRDYISLSKEAEEKGLIIDSEQVKEVERLKDAFTDVGKSIDIAVARLLDMTGLTGKLLEYAEGLTAISSGEVEKAEKQAGYMNFDDITADARKRMAESPEIQKEYAEWRQGKRIGGIWGMSEDVAFDKFARDRLYAYVPGTSDGSYKSRRYTQITHASEIAKKQEEARLAYEHREIEARGLQEEETTRLLQIEQQERLAEEARRIEEQGRREEETTRLLNLEAEERRQAEAKARSDALIASFSAPSRAGVALDGSIAAYKAQFNNERNFQHFMRENLKKSTDLQQQIATNTAALNNGLPAIVGAEIGAE